MVGAAAHILVGTFAFHFGAPTKFPFRHRMTFVYLSSSIIIRLSVSLPLLLPLYRDAAPYGDLI